MKFPMYKKETKDKGYHDDPFRAVNFNVDSDGDLVCPGGKKFHFACSKAVRGNQYGRQEEYLLYVRRLQRLSVRIPMQKDE